MPKVITQISITIMQQRTDAIISFNGLFIACVFIFHKSLVNSTKESLKVNDRIALLERKKSMVRTITSMIISLMNLRLIKGGLCDTVMVT